MGSKSHSETAALMKERRKALQKSVERAVVPTPTAKDEPERGPAPAMQDVEMADEDDIVVSTLFVRSYDVVAYMTAKTVFGVQSKQKVSETKNSTCHTLRRMP